jgi:hypothetical protein
MGPSFSSVGPPRTPSNAAAAQTNVTELPRSCALHVAPSERLSDPHAASQGPLSRQNPSPINRAHGLLHLLDRSIPHPQQRRRFSNKRSSSSSTTTSTSTSSTTTTSTSTSTSTSQPAPSNRDPCRRRRPGQRRRRPSQRRKEAKDLSWEDGKRQARAMLPPLPPLPVPSMTTRWTQ